MTFYLSIIEIKCIFQLFHWGDAVEFNSGWSHVLCFATSTADKSSGINKHTLLWPGNIKKRKTWTHSNRAETKTLISSTLKSQHFGICIFFSREQNMWRQLERCHSEWIWSQRHQRSRTAVVISLTRLSFKSPLISLQLPPDPRSIPAVSVTFPKHARNTL